MGHVRNSGGMLYQLPKNRAAAAEEHDNDKGASYVEARMEEGGQEHREQGAEAGDYGVAQSSHMPGGRVR